MKNIQCHGKPLARDYSRGGFLYVGMLGNPRTSHREVGYQHFPPRLEKAGKESKLLQDRYKQLLK